MKDTVIRNLHRGMGGLCRLLVFVAVFAGAAQSSFGADEERGNPLVERLPPGPADQSASQEQPAGPVAIRQSIAEAAEAHGLPSFFFNRLIWQESRFNPRATSNAGAQGIAQFMPNTARWRGLSDPFEPSQALFASARWLRELWEAFGNLGLAAAAYNAGPYRVRSWLNGQTTLPAETRAYVKIVTGELVEHWATCAGPEPNRSETGCAESSTRPAIERPDPPTDRQLGSEATWGLQLIGDRSQAKALSDYRHLQARYPAVLGLRTPVVLARRLPGRGSATWYQVRVAEVTRERANGLCARLKQSGGACVVLRN